jgi:hypothetical protein
MPFDFFQYLVIIVAQGTSLCSISNLTTHATMALNSISVISKGNHKLSSTLYSFVSVYIEAALVVQQLGP